MIPLRYNAPITDLVIEAGRSAGRGPERDLLAAILSRAICDLRCGEGVHERSAASWIRETSYRGPWSFDWICELLALDPRALRTRLFSDEIALGIMIETLLVKKPKFYRRVLIRH